MRIKQTVKKSVKMPIPGKMYGAVVSGINVNKTGLTFEWKIFVHKNRKPKRGARQVKQSNKA